MKQSVNLLRDDLKPVIQRLTLNRAAVSVALVLFLVVATMGYAQWLEQKSDNQLTQAQQTLQQHTQRTEQLQQQLKQRQPSQQLIEQDLALDKKIAAQQRLNQQLSDRQTTHNSAPDQLMQALYQVDIEGLWLTEFSMGRQGISLTGKTIEANLLPRWMQRFRHVPLLAQSRFAVVDLDRNEQNQQTFSLSNNPLSDSSLNDSAGSNSSNSGETP
ncbi:fimbrial assembly protein PilN [Idiomarina aquatica]|uniref:Fimbrial assembly protein PilN n=1 Tax=Idiomarina aquatica TaxID=1327752 RepID=A0A4R6P545_9GAMM|nr:PilN domain-containing protein [Idiomarina aquatica]TDP32757.1 fimbrial assembly protein PilN [Idiomarina aquatica]